jgi:hypothetical protein
MDNPVTCFSPVNFALVYNFIEDAVKAEKNTFFQYEGYEIYVSDRSIIAFKERGYSLARIDKERGVYSLAKRQ